MADQELRKAKQVLMNHANRADARDVEVRDGCGEGPGNLHRNIYGAGFHEGRRLTLVEQMLDRREPMGKLFDGGFQSSRISRIFCLGQFPDQPGR